MDRIRAGRVLVRNPGYRRTIFDVSLSPDDVDAIVFMTKNPEPMEKHLDELLETGYGMLFEVTATGYGQSLEPGVPPLWKVVNSMKRISSKLGAERVVWRYDPVLFDDFRNVDWHISNFDKISKALEGHVKRCVIGFFEPHNKLSAMMESGILREALVAEMEAVAVPFLRMAESRGMEIRSCCTGDALADLGIADAGCIGPDMMSSLGIPWEKPSTPNRKGCLCVKTVDIGTYDTCPHRCVYCYANSKGGRKTSSPGEEMMADCPEEGDETVPLGKKTKRLFDYG